MNDIEQKLKDLDAVIRALDGEVTDLLLECGRWRDEVYRLHGMLELILEAETLEEAQFRARKALGEAI